MSDFLFCLLMFVGVGLFVWREHSRAKFETELFDRGDEKEIDAYMDEQASWRGWF